jgi:hypothetical protein
MDWELSGVTRAAPRALLVADRCVAPEAGEQSDELRLCLGVSTPEIKGSK